MGKKIGFCCQNIQDATAFYRVLMPATLDSKTTDNQYFNFPKTNIYDIMFLNEFILQRPYSEAHLNFLYDLKKFNVKSIIDFDDLLWGLPEVNPAYSFYSDKVKDNIFKCILIADEIQVSTSFLEENIYKFLSLAKNNPNKVRLVRNKFPNHIVPFEKQRKNWENPEKYKILWRGSPTHEADCESKLSFFQKLMNDSRFEWYFLGQPPWFIKLFPKTTKVHCGAFNDIIQYFKRIKEINPHFLLVPLIDHPFNHAKSNIAFIEGTYAGAVTVADPQFKEFSEEGISISFDEFLNHLNDLSVLEEVYNEAYSFVEDNCLLTNT